MQQVFDFAVPLLGKATFFGHEGHTPMRPRGGDNEIYSPLDVVEIARETMGGIDLDPASCADANRVVCAERYYDESDNGLVQEWSGRVFLNPPFGGKVIGDDGKSVMIKTAFIRKLMESYLNGNVEQAVFVCTCDMASSWGDPIREYASAICLTHRRLKYWKSSEERYMPQGMGSVIAYFGFCTEDSTEDFTEDSTEDGVDRTKLFCELCIEKGIGLPLLPYREKK